MAHNYEFGGYENIQAVHHAGRKVCLKHESASQIVVHAGYLSADRGLSYK
jgi:hypothetical protein